MHKQTLLAILLIAGTTAQAGFQTNTFAYQAPDKSFSDSAYVEALFSKPAIVEQHALNLQASRYIGIGAAGVVGTLASALIIKLCTEMYIDYKVKKADAKIAIAKKLLEFKRIQAEIRTV